MISVDTKKKELIGNYENRGRRWRKAKSPEVVNGQDFPDPDVPRAYPYGIVNFRQACTGIDGGVFLRGI
jgi:hypothetical protein